jgi:Acetyltransferase (GNAT) domain
VTEIVGETRRVSDLTPDELRACFELLQRLFLGVTWKGFVRDLEEKDDVMFLRDADTGAIAGFSTLTELEIDVAGKPVPVVFSGDTAVLPEYRTSFALGQELARHFHHAHERNPGRRVSYVLISKGWRTYRIMPFFFREFFPRHDAQTPPFERALIDAFGESRYPDRYDEGVIRSAAERAPRVRPDSLDADPARSDPHTDFFLRANSRYLEGEELVCAARIHPTNYTGRLRRLLGLSWHPSGTA